MEWHVVEDRSSSGGSVLHLVVVCVELRRVSGLRVFVAKGSRAVCCAGWPGCWRRVVLWGRCDIAWSGGDKLEQPASVAKAVNEAVHQHQVPAHPVQEVVCSVVLEIRLVWHGVCVEWVAADVLVDHEKKVQ